MLCCSGERYRAIMAFLFLISRNPNELHQQTVWPQYTQESREYLKLTAEVTSFASAETNFGKPRISFWLDIVPALIVSAKRENSSEGTQDASLNEKLKTGDSTTDYVIIILAVVAGVLLLCLTISLVFIFCSIKRNSGNKYVTSRAKMEVVC